jgi:hypothetical protein
MSIKIYLIDVSFSSLKWKYNMNNNLYIVSFFSPLNLSIDQCTDVLLEVRRWCFVSLLEYVAKIDLVRLKG